KQRGLDLDAARSGVGEHKAGAESEGSAGRFHGVSASGDVVHEIGLAKRQKFPSSGKVVLLWSDRAKRVLVASALGLYGLCAVNRFYNLRPGNMPGDMTGKAGVCVGVAGAVGDRNKPT